MGACASSVTVAVAFWLGSVREIAVIVAMAGLGSFAGAVYSPAFVILPVADRAAVCVVHLPDHAGRCGELQRLPATTCA